MNDSTDGDPDQGEQPINHRVPVEQMRSFPIQMYYLGHEKLADAEVRTRINELKPPVASAFFYRVDGKTYLVTARHCLSARDWDTGEWLPGSHSVEPTHLRFFIRKAPPDGKWNMQEQAEAIDAVMPLVDEEMKPLWFEHPYYKHTMDVAVLPMPDDLANNDELVVPPYEPPPSGPDDPVATAMVAQDVFVVGYPYGLESGFFMPLWTRGTIASEPAMFYLYRGHALPLLIVDARTRKGQSGSPAIIYRQPLTPVYTNSGQIVLTAGGQSRILGVYSGRTSSESDLGFVWRIEEVDKICRSEQRATPQREELWAPQVPSFGKPSDQSNA